MTNKHYFTHNSHLNNRTYWGEGSAELWATEIDDMREIASLYANIPKSKVQVNATHS